MALLAVTAVAVAPASAAPSGGASTATSAPAATGGAASTGGASPTVAAKKVKVIKKATKKKATKKKVTKKKKAKKKVSTPAPAPAAPVSDPTDGADKTGGGASDSAPAVAADGTPTDGQPMVPGTMAKIVKGVGYAPSLAPDAVKQAIWAANDIIGRPYVYGGGHASFVSKGYDCSGTVSYALHGGDLLDSPLDSGSFMKWGKSGLGQWITIFTNEGHAYVIIAGIRLDTSAADDPSGLEGPRWRPLRKSNDGFLARHPDGL